MNYYPVFLDLEGKNVLVVGGGAVALRKIETFLDFKASIYIISNKLNEKLKRLVDAEKIQFLGKEFVEESLDDVFLVVAATDDKVLNHEISEAARKRRLMVNAVDQPEDCDFIVPAIVKRGDFMIAVSSSGKSPAFAKFVRSRLEGEFGSEYGTFLRLMGYVRKAILSKGLSQKENSRIFNEIVDSDILEAISKNDIKQVMRKLGRLLPEDFEITETDLNNIIFTKNKLD